MTADESSARTSLKVRAQPASNAPAADVFHAQPGSFHSPKAEMLPSPDATTALTWVSTALSQLLQLTHWYGKFGYQSGMRTTTLAPALAASGATTRASPPGPDSPLGSCLPPGAIC